MTALKGSLINYNRHTIKVERERKRVEVKKRKKRKTKATKATNERKDRLDHPNKAMPRDWRKRKIEKKTKDELGSSSTTCPSCLQRVPQACPRHSSSS